MVGFPQPHQQEFLPLLQTVPAEEPAGDREVRADRPSTPGRDRRGRLTGHTGLMASPSASTKTSLGQKLHACACGLHLADPAA
jgi:hypothetical protein